MTKLEAETDTGTTRVVEGRQFRLLIGGELTGAVDGRTATTINPSTGGALAEVPVGGRADVGRAVEAAKLAWPSWDALGVRGRWRTFQRLADAVEEQAEDLALLDALDAGLPIDAMRLDLRMSVDQIREWPAIAMGVHGETIPASPGNLHYTTYRPYGVVGRIVPFNHPVFFSITRILAPLIAGNAVVLKPPPQAPLSALAFGEIARDILPPGVLNIVAGDAEAGDAIVTHPAVKRIAFTGSVPTGMMIQRRAAETGVKHVTLELGGKNAMIVFPDVDLDRAVEGAIYGMGFTATQGQSCGSNSRVFVHRSIHDEFVRRMTDRLRAIRVGPAYSPQYEMGPLVSAEHHARVMGYVEKGRQEGATLACGGGRPGDGAPADGFFLQPTVFTDVRMDMDIAREEIFGPVVCVLPWDDYDTVVAEANEVELGLTASVWTNDLHLAHKTAERLEAGYVWINDSTRHYWGTPFGGMKNSGVGSEESVSELLSYLEVKAVHTILDEPEQRLRQVDLRPPT